MVQTNSGLLIVVIGLVVVAIGLLVWSGALSCFGRLPGDVRVDRDGFHFYFPITSMIVSSLVLGLLLKLIRTR